MANSATDWGAIWDQQMKLSSLKWDDPNFLYERTRLPSIGIRTSNYVDELLARMELSAESSVLDMGCGDGAISVRMAKRVQQVTALDFDPGLLFSLTDRVMKEGLGNLQFVNEDWFQIEIGTDIEQHDIVLASRFRQMIPLQKFLEQMDRAARRFCYLTWIVNRKELDPHICEILGKEYYPLPEYNIIPSMLASMGINAHVDIFEAAGTHKFETIEQAVEDATRGYRIENEQASEQITSLVQNELTDDGGYLCQDTSTTWALIWWGKII